MSAATIASLFILSCFSWCSSRRKFFTASMSPATIAAYSRFPGAPVSAFLPVAAAPPPSVLSPCPRRSTVTTAKSAFCKASAYAFQTCRLLPLPWSMTTTGVSCPPVALK